MGVFETMNEMIIQAIVTTVVASVVGVILSLVRDKVNNPRKHALKTEIGLLYCIYREKKCIPDDVRKWLYGAYDDYKRLNGNSYIDDIMNEMKGWDNDGRN